jgi:hypothetical protein
LYSCRLESGNNVHTENRQVANHYCWFGIELEIVKRFEVEIHYSFGAVTVGVGSVDSRRAFEIVPKDKKTNEGKESAQLFASETVASTYGKHMDERATMVASALAKKASADAHVRVAGDAEQDFRAAVLASLRQFEQIAEELFPQASPENRARLIASMISAYGARALGIHLNSVRASGSVQAAQAHLESLPEF